MKDRGEIGNIDAKTYTPPSLAFRLQRMLSEAWGFSEVTVQLLRGWCISCLVALSISAQEIQAVSFNNI